MKSIRQVIEGMIKEIKEEMLGKEFSLLDMDNRVLDILESWGNEPSRDKNSIFDGSTEDYTEDGDHTYSVYIDELDDNVGHDINITFDILDKNENMFETLVKVTEAEEI